MVLCSFQYVVAFKTYICTFTKEETAVYRNAKELHQEEIAGLYDQRDMAFEREDWKAVFSIRKEINKKVKKWNKTFPKEPTYLDLHWMTARGGIDYVARMTHGSVIKWIIETRRGRHSSDGEPKIKNELLEIYGKYTRVHAELGQMKIYRLPGFSES